MGRCAGSASLLMRLTAFSTLLVLCLAACSEQPKGEEPTRAVRTLTVQADATGLQHEYAADVRARAESRMAFQVPGRLQSRAVGLGEQVSAGQVIARLDARDLSLGREAAQAAANAAATQVALNEAELKRFRDLRDQGFISGLEYERREAAVTASRAQLQQARAQASAQGNQAGYAALTASASGVVTSVEAEPGMVVAAGQTVVKLALDGPRDAVFSVPEDRVGAVRELLGRPGQLRLKLWGSEAGTLPATVREVAAAADPVSRTFLVKADVGRTPVRLGQTASIRIAEPRRDDAIRLPLAAVVEAKGQSVVWLLDTATMKVRQQPVQVGGADGNLVLIAAGLKPGDRVVTAGTHVLTPGQQVRLYQAAQPASAAFSPAPSAVSAAASVASR